MFRKLKRRIRLTFYGIVLLCGIMMYHYVHTLRTQFPNMDISRMRIGIASWYSKTDPLINKHTANNEVFDDEKMTCASWHYPFNERLLVINLLGGRWTVCRVNDRGPHRKLGREIDLTQAAFKKIAPLKKGLRPVLVIPTQKH
jgi:rare lipoprotein A (peptidoglycan hydrolase)